MNNNTKQSIFNITTRIFAKKTSENIAEVQLALFCISNEDDNYGKGTDPNKYVICKQRRYLSFVLPIPPSPYIHTSNHAIGRCQDRYCGTTAHWAKLEN